MLNAKTRSQVPAAGLMIASEQNDCVRISTPSLMLVADVCSVGAPLPYDERLRTGTELAEADDATARMAKPAMKFTFLMEPPRPD